MIQEHDIWFNEDDFAQPAVLTMSGRSPKKISVIYNEPGAEIMLNEQQVITTDPTALCKTADVEDAAQSDTLKISGTTYYVLKNLPQGDGTSLLTLSKDAP